MNQYDMTIIRGEPYVPPEPVPQEDYLQTKWLKVKIRFRLGTHITFYKEVFILYVDHRSLSHHFMQKYPQATSIHIEEVAE